MLLCDEEAGRNPVWTVILQGQKRYAGCSDVDSNA